MAWATPPVLPLLLPHGRRGRGRKCEAGRSTGGTQGMAFRPRKFWTWWQERGLKLAWICLVVTNVKMARQKPSIFGDRK